MEALLDAVGRRRGLDADSEPAPSYMTGDVTLTWMLTWTAVGTRKLGRGGRRH